MEHRDFCPACGRPTIRRTGGEWCRWCLGWVMEYAKPSGDHVVLVRYISRSSAR